MGSWKNFCERTHMHGFYELSDSNSKIWKAIWLAAVSIAILATSVLVFNAANNFIQQPVRIMVESAEPNRIPYPPMHFCFMHWIQWVNWSRVVEELQFSKSEFLYAMSYLNENTYSSEQFNSTEIEENIKHKLISRNMTLRDFYETIAMKKRLVVYPKIRKCIVDLTVLRKPYKNHIFDLHHLMCYKFMDDHIQNALNKGNNSSALSLDNPYRIQFNIQRPFVDQAALFLNNYEYNKLIQDFIQEWHTDEDDYRNNIPIMFYPDGHSSNFILLYRHQSGQAIEVTLSAYIQKHSRRIGESCDCNQKSLANTNMTFLEDCIEESRMKILSENNAEEAWLGFTDSALPKKIHFLDETGNIIENSTFTRHHKLEKFDGGQQIFGEMNNKTQEIINNCSDKAGNGCEVWDIQFSRFSANPNGRPTVNVYYSKPDQITMMKEVNVQTWSNFVGQVGGVLGIWTGASVLTIFQFFYLLLRCYSDAA